MDATGPGDHDQVAEIFAKLAVAAGEIVLRHYCRGVPVRTKADSSPVTRADEETEAFLLAELAKALPGMPVIAEEKAARGDLPACGSAFVLVDPLDGTKEFLRENGEFTVNLALIEGGAPRAGAVYAPVSGRLWAGGDTAWVATVPAGGDLSTAAGRHVIRARVPSQAGLVVLESRSHPDPRLEQHLATVRVVERRKAGSSLKFCLIAEGEADYYPRFGPTMEWDTAAGDAVLRAAGGLTETLDGQPLRYGKALAGYHNPDFVARGARPV